MPWLRHVCVDRAEGVADLRPELLDDEDDDGGDQGNKQPVLNRGRAPLLAGPLTQPREPGLEPHIQSEHLHIHLLRAAGATGQLLPSLDPARSARSSAPLPPTRCASQTGRFCPNNRSGDASLGPPSGASSLPLNGRTSFY